MVNAKPEHGATEHSLAPELSTVDTSTIPGPFAVPIVQAPSNDCPLTQRVVNDGLMIRDPRVALVGLRKVESALTWMSKPANGCEFSTRTPTVKVEPRV